MTLLVVIWILLILPTSSFGRHNVTFLLYNEWFPGNSSQILVDKSYLTSQTFAERIEFLEAVSTLCSLGYDFSLDENGRGEFSRIGASNVLRIPSVLHQTWKSVDIRSHSPDAVDCTALLKKHARDFFHVLWTDNDIFDFIKRYYPNDFNYYLRLNMNIKRADIARYLILHKFGGAYVDLDIELKYPLGRLLHPPQAAMASPTFVSYRSKEFEKHREPFAGNALFACVPNSPIMKAVLKHAKNYGNQAVKDVYGVLRHTGPMGLGLVVQRVAANPVEYPGELVIIYNSTMVGNVEDSPLAAVHRRKHKWGH